MKALTLSDLMSIHRINRLVAHPQSKKIGLEYSVIDLEANCSFRKFAFLDFEGHRTEFEGFESVRDVAWSMDGRQMAFVARKDEKDSFQIWVGDSQGDNARQLSQGYGGASCLVWSAQGDRILFTREVYACPSLDKLRNDRSEDLSHAEVYGLCHSKSSARIADSLLYRHWDSWRDGKRNHLFIIDVKSGEMRDLTEGDVDCPPLALGSRQDYHFSPDGNEIVYVKNPDEVIACSTNNSIFIQKISGIDKVGAERCISDSMACDVHPVYWDQDRIVYLGMEEAGYEADYNRVKVFDKRSGETKVFLSDFERSPDCFSIIGAELYFLAQDYSHGSLYRLNLDNGEIKQLCQGYTIKAFCIPGGDVREIVCGVESLDNPAECVVFKMGEGFEPIVRNGVKIDKRGAETKVLTHFGHCLDGITRHAGERFWYKGADGVDLEGWILKPPGFKEGEKYPFILLIHGGPQGAFSDDFHYRWNVQMFASTGAVVGFCNPRGSTGYGREITRQISCDWGNKCHDDIMLFVDNVLERYPFIDGERMGAAGASFGGYSVNWIAGHSDRFKALVSHDGIFHTENSAYMTDELWFSEKEFGGKPYDVAENFTKASPHLSLKNFKTPMLVIQGEQDFRCCVSEGLGLFNALQMLGVESRLLYFPDEGHWVLKPANAAVWYHEVLGWLKKFI